MQHRIHAKAWGILNLIGFIGVAIVNGLANGLPINGMTTGEVSDLYPNLFVPAGITFSIWGLIYFLLACFIIHTLLGAFRSNDKIGIKLEQIGPWFFISCVANAAWIFAWHHRMIPLSVGLMLVLLVSLLVIYIKIRRLPLLYTKREYFFIQLPFGVYLGWISIATIANISALLVAVGWNRFGLGEDIWLTIMLTAAVLLGVFIIYKMKDFEYAAVIIWALVGIIIKRNQMGQTGFIGFYTAIVGIVVLVISLYIFLRPRNSI